MEANRQSTCTLDSNDSIEINQGTLIETEGDGDEDSHYLNAGMKDLKFKKKKKGKREIDGIKRGQNISGKGCCAPTGSNDCHVF